MVNEHLNQMENKYKFPKLTWVLSVGFLGGECYNLAEVVNLALTFFLMMEHHFTGGTVSDGETAVAADWWVTWNQQDIVLIKES